MAINLQNNPKNRIKLDLSNTQEKNNQNIKNDAVNKDQPLRLEPLGPVEQAKRELTAAFVQDMTDSAMDNSITEEELLAAEKRHKTFLFRRKILLYTILVVAVLLIIFGFTNTFLKHEISPQEIALYANQYNGKTNFPEEGIAGFLRTNVSSNVLNNIISQGNVGTILVNELSVSKISQKNDTLANVYFYMTIFTDLGESRLNCLVPVQWNAKEWEYELAGDVIVTSMRAVDRSAELVDNPLWSFENIDVAEQETNNSAKIFMDNLFTMLYGGKDVTPYYSGTDLYVGNLEYLGINKFQLYANSNLDGYNAVAEIKLNIKDTGLTYVTTKMIKIDQNGQSWMVSKLV